jgi:hypothetical protein
LSIDYFFIIVWNLYIACLPTGRVIDYFILMNLINESVSVDLLSNHIKGFAIPWTFEWRGRRYRTNKVGLHHTERIGRTLYHIFSVTDGTSFFKLKFDTETLNWKLIEVEGS